MGAADYDISFLLVSIRKINARVAQRNIFCIIFCRVPKFKYQLEKSTRTQRGENFLVLFSVGFENFARGEFFV